MRRPAATDPAARRRHLDRGERGEWWAALSLRLKGYRILARRFRTKGGEIDIVARRGDTIAIVEVKARPTLEQAMEAVGPAAQARIESAADAWLRRRPDHARLSLRFDIVAVLPRRWPIHVVDAWRGR
ncbi:YraN family protein [Antarcticirhabdus aurantiaca]|uniref:YraN family protein n=1 Tax=Antarcticirhabdus aurantiaca TaxID=2606717 RepID=A0ACD4NRL3_9HYPH|nr:YraN family protein [Antarcticirhabdus aurantiaca]WAJ29571.1 YraN family protein [Jeongeuplla avenae]